MRSLSGMSNRTSMGFWGGAVVTTPDGIVIDRAVDVRTLMDKYPDGIPNGERVYELPLKGDYTSHFTLGRKLGEGSFGVAYDSVFHTEIGDGGLRVVVKVSVCSAEPDS